MADTLLNYASCCNVINNYSNYCSQLHYTREMGAVADVDGNRRHAPYYDSNFTQDIIINTKDKKNLSKDIAHT